MTHLLICIAAIVLLALPAFGQAPPKPNVVFVLGDDCTFSDLPLYGGTNVKTPNLDRLARQGLTFDSAYVSMPMCTPTRAALYTGQYPTRNGAAWNHAASKPGTQSWAQHLGRLGYRVGLAGKTHVQPKRVFAFETVPGVEGNPVSETAEFETSGMREFITRNDDEPFALVVGLVVPHVPWTVGDRSAFDAASLQLPPILADAPGVRKAFVHYLAEIAEMDRQLGEVMNLLDETGHAEDTVLIFCSEQGAQMPGAKWNLWDVGTHTGLVVRWPGVVEGGRRTDALVQDVDLLPTLVDAAGGTVGDAFDGVSFLPVLKGQASRREYVYTTHNNVPEGPPYPMRSVTDGRWHYVRNLAPDHAYLIKFMMGGDGRDSGLWKGMVFAAHDDPEATRLLDRVLIRPAEHLYDLEADPAEMHDLAGDPEYAQIKARLSAELDRHMAAVGDEGASMDTMQAMRESNAHNR